MNNVRLGLVQMEILPGEPAKNVQSILTQISALRDSNFEILVFPEMCVPGYLLGDMWERPAFINECRLGNDRIIDVTSQKRSDGNAGPTIIFGTVIVDETAKGEDGRPRKFNGFIVAQHGKAIVHTGLNRPYGIKTLLPNYREFDDSRHFYDTRKLALELKKPWESFLEPITLKNGANNIRLGIVLCEDAWDDDYAQKPLEVLVQKGCDLLLNLSCSPFTQGKNSKRNRVFSKKASDLKTPLCYINSVSLQNNAKTLFAFDGRTTAYGIDGNIVAELPAYQTGVLSLEVNTSTETGLSLHQINENLKTLSLLPDRFKLMEEIYPTLKYGADKFLKEIGQCKVVIGVSGGIDSAVVAAFFRSFLPPENILLVNLPSRYNSQTTIGLAQQLAKNLRCLYTEISIEESVALTQKQLQGLEISSMDGKSKTTLQLSNFVLENIQARDRSSRVLAALAAAFGGVFTCNANKAEMTVGYSTLYGDLGGFLAVLGDLWKNEVYLLGQYLNEIVFGKEMIPKGSFSIVPSAELSAQQAVDEGKGDPLIYPYHDKLFFSWVQKWNRSTPEEILEWYLEGTVNQNLGCDPLNTNVYALFPKVNEFISDLEKWWNLYCGMGVAKRVQAPPILAVSSRSFGFDHRESLGVPFYSAKYLLLKQKALA